MASEDEKKTGQENENAAGDSGNKPEQGGNSGGQQADPEVEKKKEERRAKREKEREKRREDQKKAAKDVKRIKDYTYRDFGQELIMRRKMWRYIILFIMTLIALIVFIALYISEKQRVQETYRAQFKKNMESLIADIDTYLDADGNHDLWYRMITTDAACADNFGFLLNDFTEEQKSINGLYTVILKYPEQTKEKLEQIKPLVQGIIDYEKDCYTHLDEFIDTYDLKGY